MKPRHCIYPSDRWQLPAAPPPKGGIWLVGVPTLCSWAVSLDFIPYADAPATQDLPSHKKGEDPIPGANTADLCREVRSTDWGPLQHIPGTPEVYGPTDELEWGWNCRGLIAGASDMWTPEEEATLLGDEVELQKFPEVPEATVSPQPCLETPQPVEPAEQIDALSTPAPSSPTTEPHC